MTLLLDAHAFLWFIAGDPKLSSIARALIEDQSNTKNLSVATLWEIAIKNSLGKLTFALPFGKIIPEQLRVNGIEVLGINLEHLDALIGLPLYHRDPFDRLLVAQATVERIPIVSADVAFDAYSVSRLW